MGLQREGSSLESEFFRQMLGPADGCAFQQFSNSLAELSTQPDTNLAAVTPPPFANSFCQRASPTRELTVRLVCFQENTYRFCDGRPVVARSH